MKRFLSFAAILAMLLLTGCGRPKIRLGLIVSGSAGQRVEADALAEMVNSTGCVSCKKLPIGDLNRLERFDAVWYHRPDTTAFTSGEVEVGKHLSEYVAAGGKLILSMDGVRLLNAWGIEPVPIESYIYEAVDEGFGRKLGFHAYREHPLFDGMFGGAYPWHGKEDNVCRLNGFTGDALPLADSARVIATQWEYIFNRPDKKLIWETSMGKGNILAVGGCLYYGRDNFHTAILERFTLNCLRYMRGDEMESRAMYWDYTPAEVVSHTPSDGCGCHVCSAEYRAINPPAPIGGEIPKIEIKLSRVAEEYYFDLSGQQTMLVGQERGGIEEIWTHPFMSLRDYRVMLDIEGQEGIISLSDLEPVFELYPYAVVRRYKIDEGCFTETITQSVDRPVTIVHYEWDGVPVRNIITDFKSNLRYMWPYDESALGSLYYDWSPELNAFVVRDAEREFVSVIGSNHAGTLMAAGWYDGFDYAAYRANGIPTNKLQVAAAVSYDVRGMDAFDVVMAAGNTAEDGVLAAYSESLCQPADAVLQAAEYYDDYLASSLQISTPDVEFDEAYRWAVISSMQFITETPGIGRSLMAGYSSSRRGWGGGQAVSGRPGYAWYFGRDAVWSGFAFADIGDFHTVRSVLETLIAHQQIDGKIYHELTTSGFVHFDASDATPLFVNLMARYLRSSGDIGFIKRNMAAVHKAMEYCYSTDTDGDGLIEISNVGHGWLEGGELFGSHTEFYLCGIWKAALADAAYLSAQTGESRMRRKYSRDEAAITSVIEEFWNEGGYYNYGKRCDGSFTDEFLILTAVPAYFGVIDTRRAAEMASLYSHPSLSTDWGVRTIAESSDIHEASAYGPRNVWPLFTGWASLAEYKTGLYTQAYAHLVNNLFNCRGMALGRIPEVINGDRYRSNGITLHQCWSETMAIMPLVEGMLGFSPNAPQKRMSLAPRLPFDWDRFEASNLRVGAAAVGFSMAKAAGEVKYRFTTDQPLEIVFSPTFPPGTMIEDITIDGRDADFSVADNSGYLTVTTTFKTTLTTEVTIKLTEGISALASTVLPVRDQPSCGFRVLGQTLTDSGLEICVAGRSGTIHDLEIYLPDGKVAVEGASSPLPLRDNVYTVAVRFGEESEPYVTQTVKISRLP